MLKGFSGPLDASKVVSRKHMNGSNGMGMVPDANKGETMIPFEAEGPEITGPTGYADNDSE